MSQTRNSRLPAARAEEAGWEKLALAFSPRCLICQAQIVAARRACKSEGGALAIPTSDVAVLWDYVSLVTEKAVERISHMGGLKPIAISHPRYYSALAE